MNSLKSVDDLIAVGRLSDSLGTADYENNMNHLAAQMAQRFLEGHPVREKRVWIVASNEDYEMLAVPIRASFEAAGATCSATCLWASYEATASVESSSSTLVGQAHQHDRKNPVAADILLNVSMSLSEGAVVADNACRIAEMVHPSEVFVLTLTASVNETNVVESMSALRGVELTPIVPFARSEDSTPGHDLLEYQREHLRRTYSRTKTSFIPSAFGGPAPNFKNYYTPSNGFDI